MSNKIRSLWRGVLRVLKKTKSNNVILFQEFVGDICCKHSGVPNKSITVRYDNNGKIEYQEYWYNDGSLLTSVFDMEVGDRVRAFVFVVKVSDDEVKKRCEIEELLRTLSGKAPRRWEPKRIAGADSI